MSMPNFNGADSAQTANGSLRTESPHRTWVQSLSLLRTGPVLALIALSTYWLLLFDTLRREWTINAQYSFGWLVPLLGATLFWRRWSDRPAPSLSGTRWSLGFAVIVLAFLLLPLRLVLEANPEWRLAYWIQAAEVIGLTGCFFYRAGGASWVRHFAFPVFFMLIAVPWPMGLEQDVIQGLMRFVAAATVEVVGFVGIPALQHANVVEIGNGLVGIDEACSGVRSFLSALMIALFLGEHYRFSVRRRIWVFLASTVLVILANMGRTSFLVWAAAKRGFPQMEAWHDTAGQFVMWTVLICLFGIAWAIRPRSGTAPQSESPAVHPGVCIPGWVGVTALIWLVTSLSATELWYQAHESKLVPNTPWTISWPASADDFKETGVPANALAILRCSNSKAARWRDGEGNDWSAFLLRWDAGENSTQLAKGHRPEICLTSAGATLQTDFGFYTTDVGGVRLRFHHQTFASDGRLMHVFYCLWADKVSPVELALKEDGSRTSRLDAVLAGKRNLGQQVLELVVVGPESKEEARQSLDHELVKLVTIR